ncbi:MAG: cell envelope protein SmpA [Cycloclasticus sp. symbiont of Poecilosclerida sp. N]|nr:MAG: cell envelope protein SmpA [Cycloclasticus sp. symbiont of Poecilosclerida sp. N]
MRKFLLLITALILTACSTPKALDGKVLETADNLFGIYKIDVKQGNLVSQEMINQLRPGMDKKQVKFILGTPLLIDPFHKNRWDYFYDLKKSGKQDTKKRATIIFVDGQLVSLKGDFRPSNESKPMTINTTVVDVPKQKEKEKGILEEILHSLGIEYDEKY